MIYGLYLSAQGAQAQATRVDVIANNVANSSTGGFKRDLALFQSHRRFDQEHLSPGAPENLQGVTGGVTVAEVVTDFSDGPLQKTGAPLDVALRGPGFLRVTDGQQTFLTRDGRLSVNERGELVSQATGHAVLATGNTPITIPQDSTDITISANGSVLNVLPDGEVAEVGRLDLVRPESLDELQKMGNNLYRAAGRLRPAAGEVRVLQGHLESSGTRPVLETMDLIDASRAFETNVNMIRLQDDSLAQLLQSVRRQ